MSDPPIARTLQVRPLAYQRLCNLTPENRGTQGYGTDKPVAGQDPHSSGVRLSVVLVVDDEAPIRNLVALLMQQDGYFVLSAADGQEGLELSRLYSGFIDLVITDMQMPRVSGIKLCACLFEERPGIKALLMSGSDVGEFVAHDTNLPFLPKPFDGQNLRARVRAILAVSLQPPNH